MFGVLGYLILGYKLVMGEGWYVVRVGVGFYWGFVEFFFCTLVERLGREFFCYIFVIIYMVVYLFI